MSFGVVDAPFWDDRDLYIVGGGESLIGRDLSQLNKKGRVLGVNRAPDFVPCDVFFTIDHTFLRKRRESIEQWAASGMEAWACAGEQWFDQEAAIPLVKYLIRVQGTGIDAGPGTLINGLNSGYCAVCLAVLKRAKRIYMLGYDLNGENGHWQDGYDWGTGRTKIYFERWAAKFDDIARDLPPDVQVLNCNPDSGVTAFPFSTYDDIGI